MSACRCEPVDERDDSIRQINGDFDEPDAYVILETVESDECTYRIIVPRGRVYPTRESAERDLLKYADSGHRVRHYVGAVWRVGT